MKKFKTKVVFNSRDLQIRKLNWFDAGKSKPSRHQNLLNKKDYRARKNKNAGLHLHLDVLKRRTQHIIFDSGMHKIKICQNSPKIFASFHLLFSRSTSENISKASRAFNCCYILQPTNQIKHLFLIKFVGLFTEKKPVRIDWGY